MCVTCTLSRSFFFYFLGVVGFLVLLLVLQLSFIASDASCVWFAGVSHFQSVCGQP